jgi:adenosine deaminase
MSRSGCISSPPRCPCGALVEAGVAVALGADDPLLFGSRLVDQYAMARDVLGFDDAGLAELARGSVRAARMPAALRTSTLNAIDDWLAAAPV